MKFKEMIPTKKILVTALITALLLCGCGKEQTAGGSAVTDPVPTVDFSQSDSDLFTDRDYQTTYDSAVSLNLNEASETVTITAAGTYLLSGSFHGSVVINAAETDKVQLVLCGADICNEAGAAICILSADKVFVTLAEGTRNSLSTGETLASVSGYEVDAALYSRCDLTINGSGSLTVTSPAGHGISGKDDLAITGGDLTVHCANQGLDANNSIRICGGSFTINAGKDGLHAEHAEDASLGFVYISGGSFDIEAQGDGISASAHLQIEAGTFEILAGGGWENGEEHSSDNWGNMGPGGMGPGGRPRSTDTATEEASTSMKGLKAGSDILIRSGTLTIDSADDGIHSNTSMTVSGGTFTIASGDDAVHAEQTLTITGCTMDISTCYEGLEALEIYVAGGDITLKATDDGLNAAGGTDGSGMGGRDQMGGRPGAPGGMGGSSNGIINISGGTLYIHSSGDGIDSNGCFLMTGGHVTVVGPTVGDTATLDYDTTATINGGTFIGTGSSMMAQTFSENAQGVFACSVGSQSAGTRITLTDKAGNVLFDYTPELSFQVVILSAPELISGEEYTITVGSLSGTLAAD